MTIGDPDYRTEEVKVRAETLARQARDVLRKHCSECDATEDDGKIREFDTGATRDSEEGKLDYEGFLSPLVLRRYAEYMHKHRKQSDGKMRNSDNWQKGIPLTAYMKSLWRHVIDLWTLHRVFFGGVLYRSDKEEALCAIIFNASGYLHELMKIREDNENDCQD